MRPRALRASSMTAKPTHPCSDVNDSLGSHEELWPCAHVWAIDQMPLPAFICGRDGAVLSCNAMAETLWGRRPNPREGGRWHGWKTLLGADGHPLSGVKTPPAQTLARGAPWTSDVLFDLGDGDLTRATMSCRPVFNQKGSAEGVICAVTIIGPVDPSQLEDRAVFLSTLSHELRNPLSPIMCAASALRSMANDPKVAKMADVVERQSKQLARFVADLLDASRLHHASEVPCAMRDSDVGSVLDAALDAVDPTLRSRGQTLAIRAPDRSTALRCDPARLAQALGNALRNASAHSPDGAQIELCVGADRDMLLISVDDLGAGIDADVIERAAEPFVQGATAPGRAPSGAGLGLAIAKGICAAHGGAMAVSSPGPGLGAHVEFILPVVRRDAGPSSAVHDVCV